jgi:VirE N-terminal domain
MTHETSITDDPVKEKPHAQPCLSLFENSINPKPIGEHALAEALGAIRQGLYQAQIDRLRQILARQGKNAYDRAKKSLHAYTFGGTFAHRNKESLLRHSGIVHLDIDGLADAEAARRQLIADPYVVYCFVSPSGTGLKLGVWVVLVSDDAAYKIAWQQVSEYFAKTYHLTVDKSGKDICRLCYVSADPDLYFQPGATPFPLTDPRDRYTQQAIKNAVDIIEASRLGNRHHARVRASNLLGGYVAGGFLTYDMAYAVLAEAVRRHTDDFERSTKTILDGLAYGQSRPFNLSQLEDEREAWWAAHAHNGQPHVSDKGEPPYHSSEDRDSGGDQQKQATDSKQGRTFGGVSETANGYYRRRTIKEKPIDTHISSFIVQPTLRIWVDGSEAVRANIGVGNKTLAEVTIERHCWHSRGAFLKVLTSLDHWCIATDNEIQAIQAMVAMQKVPSKRGTRMLGLVDGVWVSDEGIFDKSGWIQDPELVYLPVSGESPLTGRLHYRVQNPSARVSTARAVYERLWKLNELTVIGALIGWFFSTPFKPHIQARLNHFPILNVWGTMGAGKTSLLRLFWKLFGVDSELLACTDTEFSLLSLLSATSSIPLVFDEFKPYDMKPDQVRRFERILRRVYDGDTEHRGRPDLRLITYRLMAPVAVAGEVSVARQPAMRERIIPVSPSKTWLPEHEDARKAYWELVRLPLHTFASLYIEWSMRQDFISDWGFADQTLTESVNRDMPERIRDGLQVVSFGLRQFERFGQEYGLSVPEELDMGLIFNGILDQLVNADGRSRVGLDVLLEHLSAMAEMGRLVEGRHYIARKVDDYIALRLDSCLAEYRRYAKDTASDDEVLSKESYLRQLRENHESKGYVVEVSGRAYFGNDQLRVVKIDRGKAEASGIDLGGFTREHE